MYLIHLDTPCGYLGVSCLSRGYLSSFLFLEVFQRDASSPAIFAGEAGAGLPGQRGLEPIEVGLVSPFNGESQQLGQFIAVGTLEKLAEWFKLRVLCFNEQKNLLAMLDSPLPPIPRVDVRNEIHASGQLCFEQLTSDSLGFLRRASGGQDQSVSGAGGGSYSFRRQTRKSSPSLVTMM